MSDFFVKINDFVNTRNFGVYSSIVNPPDACVCRSGDKPFCRFFYVKKGCIVFNENTEGEIRVPQGYIAYLPNNVTYKSKWETFSKGEYISVNFISDDRYISLPHKITIAAYDKNGYYLETFTKLYNVWLDGGPGYKLEILSEIYRIIYSLFNDNLYKMIKSKHSAIYKGIMYLENHYLEDTEPRKLAEMCNVSESTFRRLFKKYKQMSPVTYKNYLRIKKATDLLKSGEYNVTEAANAVNLPDLCYFYKLFKKFYNCSPKKFIPQ